MSQLIYQYADRRLADTPQNGCHRRLEGLLFGQQSGKLHFRLRRNEIDFLVGLRQFKYETLHLTLSLFRQPPVLLRVGFQPLQFLSHGRIARTTRPT